MDREVEGIVPLPPSTCDFSDDDELELYDIVATIINASASPKKKLKRQVHRDHGETPKESIWWKKFVESKEWSNPAVSAYRRNVYREHFRMTQLCFERFLELIRSHGWLQSEEAKPDATGREGAPLELKILGFLYCVGNDVSTHTLRFVTNIGKQSHDAFQTTFLEFASTTLYDHFVTQKLQENISKSAHLYDMAGMRGAIGSVDGTKVRLFACPINEHNRHNGKDGVVRGFQATVNFKRQVLGVCGGFPGVDNDKKKQKMDPFLAKVRNGDFNSQYSLFDSEGEQRVLSTRWIIADNGYTNWTCILAPPIAHPTKADQLFGSMLESVRKDVECTFGIIKMRFLRLLKGTFYKKLQKTDQLFITCCALHNMLLEWELGETDYTSGEQVTKEGVEMRMDRRERLHPSVSGAPTSQHELRNMVTEHLVFQQSQKRLYWPKKREVQGFHHATLDPYLKSILPSGILVAAEAQPSIEGMLEKTMANVEMDEGDEEDDEEDGDEEAEEDKDEDGDEAEEDNGEDGDEAEKDNGEDGDEGAAEDEDDRDEDGDEEAGEDDEEDGDGLGPFSDEGHHVAQRKGWFGWL